MPALMIRARPYSTARLTGAGLPEHDIVIIGISAGQIDWGKGAIAHE
jgi:hypothetical protein